MSRAGFNSPGLARMALIAPAMPPARATCCMLSSGKGEINRLDAAYEAKRREFTPAIPRSGLAMPVVATRDERIAIVDPDGWMDGMRGK